MISQFVLFLTYNILKELGHHIIVHAFTLTLTRCKLHSIFIVHYMRKEDKVTLIARERPKQTAFV